MKKGAWKQDLSVGYGRHEYRQIDPSLVDPEAYTRVSSGEKMRSGDVRVYSTASNDRHPETDVDLYDCGLMGTKIEIHGEGPWADRWIMVGIPTVKSSVVFLRAARWDGTPRSTIEDIRAHAGEGEDIPAFEVGLAVNEKNLYAEVKVTLIKRGLMDGEQRQVVETGRSTRERLQEQARKTGAGAG